ncbi:short chain dehydrogenase reductase family isoform B [Chlorella sorokiniana]|uniref:Short chain dehydrogenase reductase family isoform B n=1 Tax=Chlorella sorokiniana TaxID=3076 RepID=A0A2P6TX01_CHLSO|nr:short chain dehydrogenase reductase family isoform B [Chlorella sorokiniana]|eukprot:PRW58590.1 short chain dehydrogenase reductase family isoform B [Chlorella sorokiniana]
MLASQGRLLGRQAGSQQGALRCLAAKAGGTPMVMKATVDAYGEGATTVISKEQFRFLVDEPVKLGGKGLGPNPLSVLLGSLVGCTQYTCSMIAKEMKLGGLGAAAWSAAGEYDLRGVRGESGVDARFQRIQVQGTFDGPVSQADLDRITEQVDRRCIVAATLKASGLDMQLSLQKGTVDHQCEPACALHDLEAQGGGATGKPAAVQPHVEMAGQAKGGSRREADAPQFAGTGGQGRATARAFCTLAHRGLYTGPPAWAKDGEDVAREHMGAHAAPQLQKETSEKAGAATTAGGAYASRDDPEAQAAQPTQGKSDEQIVQEQGAGSTVHPQSAGNAEGGAPMDQGAAHSPGFADRAVKAGHEGRSPLGDQPAGDEIQAGLHVRVLGGAAGGAMLALARQRAANSGSHLLQLVRGLSLGYEAFGEDAASNLKGKVVLITGSTDGIGKHTAALLAQQGATTLVHGRNRSRVQRTLRELRSHTANPSVYAYCYDMNSLAQTRAFAEHIRRDVVQHFDGRLHCLINNAGVFNEEMVITEDGLEETWAVNVAAPFLLTASLIDIITERIINVSSISLSEKLDFDNLQGEKEYGRVGHQAYSQSKLALNMWSFMLAAKLHKARHPAVVHCIDPGAAATKVLLAGWGEVAHSVAMRAHECSDEEWAVRDAALARCTGRYWVNRKPRLSPKGAHSLTAQQRLWDILVQQTGADFALPQPAAAEA